MWRLHDIDPARNCIMYIVRNYSANILMFIQGEYKTVNPRDGCYKNAHQTCFMLSLCTVVLLDSLTKNINYYNIFQLYS